MHAVSGQWPMSNDSSFNFKVKDPLYKKEKGPKILLDGAHHNFFTQQNFIKPFSDLATANGYRTIIDSLDFAPAYLSQFDIILIVTALPFNFTTKKEVTNESAFSPEEINSLYNWVENGGSLLVFSEHAPFDQAINPLLNKFGITSSVGTVIDSFNYDKQMGRVGWLLFSNENGLLNNEHPIIKGRSDKERINQLLTFGGSALSGQGYSNLLKLSATAKNIRHNTGVGPVSMGNSQCLAGKVGKGKVVALGDSNGFTAMLFDVEGGSKQAAGMNLQNYDWKQFVLNTLHWLSNELE